MAPTFSRAAIAGLGQLAVGADAGLGVGAPEEAIVAGWDAGIGLRPYILALPAKGRAQSRTIGIETFRFYRHATPPAFRMARFTATRASWIFWVLCPRLLALSTAARPARSAVSGVMVLPVIDWAASAESHGIGATCPNTTRAPWTVFPFMLRATAAVA